MVLGYFDCFAGAAGDMIVASCLDAGADLGVLDGQLASLGLEGLDLSREPVRRGGLAATRFVVDVDEDRQHGRHLSDILEIINRGSLPDKPVRQAERIFRRIAVAEAKVHGVSVDKIHFHEVGAIDSIVDILGAVLAMDQLGIDKIFCSEIPFGNGTIECAHGLLPVPAPATVELLRGIPTTPGLGHGEMTTPTAAGIFAELSSGFGSMPAMSISRIGYGSGTRDDSAGLANVLRLLIGESVPADADNEDDTNIESDGVVELAANIDDCTGEILASTINRLLAAGCLDAWATPAVMKKSRPAWVLSVLCHEQTVDSAREILFSETTTFGIRSHHCHRKKLSRRWETVETEFGPVRIKIGSLGDREITIMPEFEDCAEAAKTHHIAVRVAQQAAREMYTKTR